MWRTTSEWFAIIGAAGDVATREFATGSEIQRRPPDDPRHVRSEVRYAPIKRGTVYVDRDAWSSYGEVEVGCLHPQCLQEYAKKHQEKGNGFGFGLTKLDGVARTLSARYYKDGSEVLVPQRGKNPRRLTPRECARLMGFPSELPIVVSDTQAYKQFGNAVCPPVSGAVAKAIIPVLSEYVRTNSLLAARR